MTIKTLIYFFFLSPLFWNCDTGNLKVVADIPNSLKEVSAIQLVQGSELFWVIEDGGNGSLLYGLGKDGSIVQRLKITNAKNQDWEDLAADKDGNIYIADIGNNRGKREDFTIYKLKLPSADVKEVTAETITFTLPKNVEDKDMESLFILNNNCYVVTKETGKFKILKFPNSAGNYKAKEVSEINLEGKHHRITASDISEDGKTLALLTNDELYLFTGFNGTDFLDADQQQLEFKHHSQKEGVCFDGNNSFLITDENTGLGANIYRLQL